MKKKDNEFLDEEFLDEEILDDDEFLDDDEDIIDDDVIDDEEDIKDEPKKGKKGKKGKKKMSKGAIASIVVGSIVGVIAIALVAIFVVMPLLIPQATIASDFQELLAVNGYQTYVNTSDVNLRSTAYQYRTNKIVTVDEMLSESGINKNDTAKFAAALYSLAVTNYANVNGTGWYCYTDSSVFAKDVTASIQGISLSFETFNVGVRAAFGMGSMESKDAACRAAKKDDYFSQTISGVTVLDIAGLPSNLTGAVKGLFGYNMQEYLYNGVYVYRSGKNGGANFYGKDTEDGLGYRYMMGAYNASFPTKIKANAKNPDTGYPQQTFLIDNYDPDVYSESKSLDYITTPKSTTYTNEPAWGRLDVNYEYAFKLTPFEEELDYYYGNYGTGWAVYNFSEEYIDGSKTKITYDSKTKVYTIDLVVKEDKMDEACMFAKGSLTKDTKDYIQLQNPEYSLSRNVIQIFDNGLIKYWERVETVKSSEPARLTILSGECKEGGGTTNNTYMAFSYSPIDYYPIALAARYMPQIGTTENTNVPASLVQDLSGWPTFEEYDPINKDYTTLKIK